VPEPPRGLRRGHEVRDAGLLPGPVETGELEIGFAAQEQYLSFYVLRTDVMAAHLDRLGGLDLGRGASVTAVPTRSTRPWCGRLRSTVATSGPIC
jgi:hypothetical protein